MSASATVQGSFPDRPDSVPAARQMVRAALRSWGLEQLADAAGLIVTELATNALLHARSPFTVRLSLGETGQVRIEVVDGSPDELAPRAPSAAATTGRGLSIVERLATDWGVTPAPPGKLVWVHLDPRPLRGDGPEPLPGDARPPRGRTPARPPADPAGPTALAA